MKSKIKNILQGIISKLGYKIIKDDLVINDKQFELIKKKCEKYTMTSEERMYALYLAVKYIIKAKIPGDFVECGVWKGGSAMIIAHTLLSEGVKDRKIYLYDTYKGMSEPGTEDKLLSTNKPAKEIMNKEIKKGKKWLFSSLEEVKRNLISTGYSERNIIFIKGKVEDTIPKKVPSKISLLRLDTDWYESTYHEMKYLFPLLSKKGVLILDDYNYWAGSKKAVDKYLNEKKINILLTRLDSSGRLGIKR